MQPLSPSGATYSRPDTWVGLAERQLVRISLTAPDAGFMAPSAALPDVDAGSLRLLGITSLEPFPLVPDVPVLARQAGLPKDFRAELWDAFIAPAGSASAVVARLNTEITEILSDPAVQEQLLAIGWPPAPGTPTELAERITADAEMWGGIIDQIKAQQ